MTSPDLNGAEKTMFRNIAKHPDDQEPAETANTPAMTAQVPLIARFRANRRGTVAIEFAMIALPFFLLIFAIIEVALSFTAQEVMANVTDDLARQLRTGELRAANVTGNQLRDRICARLFLPEAGCPNLVVDLQTYATFAAVPVTIPLTAGGDVNAAGFKNAPGGASTINQLRVFVRWPILTNLMRDRIDSIQGTGRTLLFSTSTWKNEPFI
jgi:Flp pilus assembly protein TadG